MDIALERIRAKIDDLEAKLTNLKIAERELLELDKTAARKVKTSELAVARHVSKREKPIAAVPPGKTQTIGAAISEVLQQHGTLPAGAIAEEIIATGRDINHRAISFALQAMKKRGLVKTADGKWTLQKGAEKRTRG